MRIGKLLLMPRAKPIINLCLAVFFIISSMSFAQTETPPQTGTQSTDEVIAFGQKRGGDPAMQAFLNGDYVTAEIEFQRNYDRIRRSSTLERDAVDLSRTQASGAGLTSALTTSNGQSGGIGTSNTPSSAILFGAGRFKNEEHDENTLTSGDDIGVQLYMKGLSQIQLKKYNEAYESLTKALKFNKTLYDAHLRLGILELRNGNKVAAKKHHTKLRKLWKRCNNHCKHKVDMKETLDTFDWVLSKS